MTSLSGGSDIAVKAEGCLDLFFIGLSLLEVSRSTQLWSSLLDQLGRFQIWSSNLGVFAEVHASLDYRLREVQDVRDLILELLSSINDSLDQLNELFRVQHHDEVQREGKSYSATKDGQNQSDPEEVEEALDAIRESIGWLHRLSNSIRKASSLGQNARAEQFPLTDADDPDGTDLTSQWIELYSGTIKREFPGLDDIVRKRLARSIVSRRKRIMYRLSRHERWAFQQEAQSRKASAKIQIPLKLTQETPVGAKDSQGVKLSALAAAAMHRYATSQLTATTLQPEAVRRKKPASGISSARTKPLNTMEETLVPPPPEAAKMAKDFICPYCCNIRPTTEAIDPIKWKLHVQRDLDPYVCLFDPCVASDLQPNLFSTNREWLEHMRAEHCMRWHCVARNHDPIAFPSEEDFKKHMRTEHAGKFEDDLLEYLAASCARPLEDPFEGKCPFCAESPTDLHGHVGGHLKFLALYTLPRFDEEKNDIDNKSSSKRSNIFVKMSRSTMERPTWPVTDFSPDDPILDHNRIESVATGATETTPEGEPLPLTDFEEDLKERLGLWNYIDFISPQHEPLNASIVNEDDRLMAFWGSVRYKTVPMSLVGAVKRVVLMLRVINALKPQKMQKYWGAVGFVDIVLLVLLIVRIQKAFKARIMISSSRVAAEYDKPPTLSSDKQQPESISADSGSPGWANRPPAEGIVAHLDEFFPDLDLDQPVIEKNLDFPPASSRSVTSMPSTNENDTLGLNQSTIKQDNKSTSLALKTRRKSINLRRSRSIREAAESNYQRVVTHNRSEAPEAHFKPAPLETGPQDTLAPSELEPQQQPTFKWVKGQIIGKGTYGKVYLGMNTTTGELIAVKQVELNPKAVAQDKKRMESMVRALEIEIDTMQYLGHPNIVSYLGCERKEYSISIFLEYIPGGSIGGCLRKYGKFEEPVVHSVTRQTLSALAYLHNEGILYRDLKADNILLDLDGTCKISDFGISRKTDNIYGNDSTNSMQGSVFWMAPEMIRSNGQGYSAKVDIWSLGCLVLEMFSGRRPWSKEEVVGAIYKLGSLNQAPPIPEDVSSAITVEALSFMLDCFTIDPADRPTAARLLDHPFSFIDPNYNFFETELYAKIRPVPK